MDRTSPIGVFDSGLGGISVLREAEKLLPGEDFLYYGDSANAPYGTRSLEEVRQLTVNAVTCLINQGCKAVVIACNTATSAAAPQLRQMYPNVPILGIEPALKLAVERHPGGRILVMATARTLAGERFRRQKALYEEQAEILPVPGTGLVEFVERGILDGAALEEKIMELLSPYLKVPVDAVVLGCTHYPFLRRTLRRLLGHGTELLDGAGGVARNLRRQLQDKELLNLRTSGGQVQFRNSSPDAAMLALSDQLLHYEDE